MWRAPAFAVLLAIAAPALAQAPPSPSSAQAPPGGWFGLLEPFLPSEDVKALKAITVDVPADPLPPRHPCRVPSQFGYAELVGNSARIVMCLRNQALFMLYVGQLSTGALLRPSYFKDDYAFGYAELFGEASRAHADEQLDPETQAPCHFLQYIEMRNAGGDGAQCGRMRPGRMDLAKWLDEHPEAFDAEKMDRIAKQFGMNRAQVIERLPEVMKGNLVRVLLFTLLHESGHIRLGHLRSRKTGCAGVLEEHAADQFARGVLDKMMPTPALVELDLYWLVYHLGVLRSSSFDKERADLLEVRFLTTAASMWDRIDRDFDKPEFRQFVDVLAPSPLERKHIAEARRKMAEARTCLGPGAGKPRP